MNIILFSGLWHLDKLKIADIADTTPDLIFKMYVLVT
jgi:hypothetical protein